MTQDQSHREPPELTLEEMEQLRSLHRDERAQLSPEVLADLEGRRLIMRGWNQCHVLTALGEAALGIHAQKHPQI